MPQLQNRKDQISDLGIKALLWIFFIGPLIAVGLYLSWSLYLGPLLHGSY